VTTPSAGRKVRLTAASTIAMQRTHWLWDGRIPIGALSLLAGPEGLGKSTLAYWLAARVTQGELEGEDWRMRRSVLVCATGVGVCGLLLLGLISAQHVEPPGAYVSSITVEGFRGIGPSTTLTLKPGPGLSLVVGRNGSGKSTFLKLVAGIHRPTSGRLLVAEGTRICSMIELGVGFHPELTGRENVVLSASIHGLSRAEIEGIYQQVVEYSGLEHFIDVPIKNYSSGMYMRLGFAIAANLEPDILLLDEIFAVGDASFRLRCEQRYRDLRARGHTVLIVSKSPVTAKTRWRDRNLRGSVRGVYPRSRPDRRTRSGSSSGVDPAESAD
jgi:ABC-type multidrug transport system ATPase subunit